MVPVSVSLAITLPGEVSPIRVSHPIAVGVQAGLAYYASLFDLQLPGVHVTPETITTTLGYIQLLCTHT